MLKSYRHRRAFGRGSALLVQQRWEEAAAAFRQAIKLNASDSRSHNSLAIALLKLDAWEESACAFQTAIRLNPGFPESHANLGAAFARLERWADASRAYRRAVELDPDDAASHENLGIVLTRLERWEEARHEFELALALGPDVATRQLNLGTALLRLNRFRESSAALRRAVDLDPNLEAARQNLAVAQGQMSLAAAPLESPVPPLELAPTAQEPPRGAILFTAQRWEEAVAEFRRETESHPEAPESHSNLGAALFNLGRWKETVETLQRAIELSPEQPEAHQLLGVALDKLGRREEALLARQRLALSQPRDVQRLTDLAAALTELERWDEAAVVCRKAVALDPDVSQAHPQIPAIFARAGMWEEAAASFRRAAALDPSAVETHANLGVALVHLERWDDAADAFGAAVAAAPGRLQLREALCAVLANAGRWEEAVDACRSWASADPQSPDAQRHLAAALANVQRVDEAVAAHQRVVDAAPEDPSTRLQVGIGLCRLERFEEAISHLEAGSALAPRDATFPFLLVEPLLQLGRGPEATAAHRRAVDLGGVLHAIPEHAADLRSRRGRAGSQLTEGLAPQVMQVERWLRQLTAPPPAAPARSDAPATPSAHGSPRLLFVLDEDYGELTLLMYLALGQQVFHQSTLLLPDRLFANNQDAFPARTHRYASLEDVLHRVDEDRPDVVFLCSGYLLTIHGLFSLDELDRLVSKLNESLCHVVTTDPFLGMLSEQDPSQLVSIHIPAGAGPELQRVKDVQDQRLWRHFSHAEKLFSDSYHLYPGCDPLPAGSEQSDARNLWSFNPELVCPDLASDSSLPNDAAPHWVFILSQTDYEAQAMFESPMRFADIVAARFVDALALGRRPILVGPNEFLDLLVSRLPTTRGLDVLSYCPFDQMVSLLLGAEHAFYWNVVSHSILIRLFNQLPVCIFDKGHLIRNVTAMYDRVIQWYYRGVEPDLLDHHEPLTLERLARWEEGYRRQAGRILDGFREAPDPDRLLTDLLKRPPTPGLRP